MTAANTPTKNFKKKGLKETHTYTYVYLYLNEDTIDCCFVAQFKEHI